MWRFVGQEQGKLPIPGLPLEASDDDFEAAVERYEARFGPEGKGAVKRSGLYRHYSARGRTTAADDENDDAAEGAGEE